MGSTAIANGGRVSAVKRPHWVKRHLGRRIVSIAESEREPKRTPADRIEARLLDVLTTYERKLARGRAACWVVVMAVVVGICVIVVVLVLHSNYALRRENQVLAFDRDVAGARAACNERLRKRVVVTRAAVLTPLQESTWIGQCIEQRLGEIGSAAHGDLSTAKNSR